MVHSVNATYSHKNSLGIYLPVARTSVTQQNYFQMICVIIQGDITYAPPPPPPIFGQQAFLRGEGGGGVYFEAPCGRIFITPPSFIRPPPLGRNFSGVGGGVYKIWPRKSFRAS